MFMLAFHKHSHMRWETGSQFAILFREKLGRVAQKCLSIPNVLSGRSFLHFTLCSEPGVNIVKFILNFKNFVTKNFVFILLVLSSIEAGIPIGVHLLSPASLALILLGPLLLIIFRSRIKGTLFKKLPLILPLLAFAFVIFLSMQASADHAIAVRFSAKYFAQILTFLGFLLYFQSRKNEGKQIFIKGIVYFALLNGIVNILEKLSLPSVAKILTQIHHNEISLHPLRTQGLFQNPNTSGAFEVLGFICLLIYGMELFKNFRIRTAASITLLSGIILSESVNSLGNLFFLSILVFTYIKKIRNTKKILFFGAIVSCFLLAFLLKERIGDQISQNPSSHQTIGETLRTQDSLNQRLQIWHAAIAAIRDNPILGLGAGVFIFKTQIIGKLENHTFHVGPGQFNAHNLELNMAAGFGLLGLSAFFVFMFMIARNISDPDVKGKTILFLALITLQQIDCFLDNSFTWQLVFWGLLALIATDFSNVQRKETSEADPAKTPPSDVSSDRWEQISPGFIGP